MWGTSVKKLLTSLALACFLTLSAGAVVAQAAPDSTGGSLGTVDVGSNNQSGLVNSSIDMGVLIWLVIGASALATGVGSVVVSRSRNSNAENLVAAK